jgi:hypothetical protein
MTLSSMLDRLVLRKNGGPIRSNWKHCVRENVSKIDCRLMGGVSDQKHEAARF